MSRGVRWTHVRMVECLERLEPGERAMVGDLAKCAGITPETVKVYVSFLRGEYGYTVIDGTPATGYRLGEWPGREPRKFMQRKKREFDSSQGVIVTAAGKALGL